ncbi:MAG: hypothetical protein KGI80_00575 [Verrucomicrobiota bacterium]|nr:hypothetical protein [Verrucomicrobiota bacterium]
MLRTFFPLLCLSSALFGFYVGNPAAPVVMGSGFFSGRYLVKGASGYLYDYSTIKKYHAAGKEALFNPNSVFKEFGIHSQMGNLSMMLLERLEIFGYVGGSKEQTQGKPHPAAMTSFKGHYQFSWATGSKAVLLNCGPFSLGGSFSYFGIPSSPKSYFRYLNRINLPINFGKQNTSLSEWQINGGLSGRFGFLSPYIGGTWLYSKLHISGTSGIGAIDYENEDKWGLFFGLTVSVTGKFHINLERRLYDESGYSLITSAVF